MSKDDIKELTREETAFLRMVNDPYLRKDLLARLEEIGLLEDFLKVEEENT